MNDFRVAVDAVLTAGARGDLATLEAVLRAANGERAARLTAANLLARHGEPGAVCLRAALGDFALDSLGQLAAAKGLVAMEATWDEPCFLAAIHSTCRRVRRLCRQQLAGYAGPLSAEFTLRCCLPRPYAHDADCHRRLPFLLRNHSDPLWERVVGAIGAARYQPALPLLIEELHFVGVGRQWILAQALLPLGPEAAPTIVSLLPKFTQLQREQLIDSLGALGDTLAIETLKALQADTKARERISLYRIEWVLEKLVRKRRASSGRAT